MNEEKLPKIIVPYRDMIYFIDQAEILFCQSENCYSTLFLDDGRQFVLIKSLNKLEKELTSTLFIRVNQSYLVNKVRIRNINKKRKSIALDDTISIPFTVTIKKLLALIAG